MSMKMPVVSGLVVLMMSLASAAGAMTISDDQGGRIGDYLAKYKAIRMSGERVIIDGTCASACTMLLGAIPRSRICVTPRAVLEFHTAWDLLPSGQRVINTAGNRILMSNYPGDVRRWISRHGGLGPQMLYLRGHELAAMFRTC